MSENIEESGAQPQLGTGEEVTSAQAQQDGTVAEGPAHAPLTREDVDKAIAELPGDFTLEGPDYVVTGMRSFFGELFTADDETRVREIFRGPSTATPGAQDNDAAQNAPAQPERPVGLHLMERLQALPELAREEAAELVREGIQAFKDIDRRTMKVVIQGAKYFKQEV